MKPKLRSAVAGAIAAGLAVGLSELAAGAVASIPSLIETVAGVFIDNVPAWLKELAISLFGTNDKLALIIGMVITVLALGFVVGILARNRFWVAIVAFAAFGVLGVAAALTNGFDAFPAVIAGGIASLAGMASLSWLYGRMEADEPATADDGATEDGATRRSFLFGAGALVGVAALSAGAGRILIDRVKQSIAGRGEVVLPTAAEIAAEPATATMLEVEGLTPLVVPNEDFYLIDTVLSPPQVDLSTWTVRIHGMVDREVELSFSDLMDMDMVERYVTLSCVSNEVGGRLVGNAKWLGVPLQTVLEMAGVQDGAEQIIGRSVPGDDFTVGFPVEAAFDGRDALIAIGMNDEPLPFEHGFPARLVVAGLYGYVSATKWLSEIELTTWDGFDAYWIDRGWGKEGPIKTQSRIDTPRPGNVPGGEQAIAGVAWAPYRGISLVEVQIDEGDWVEAQLAESLGDNSWRQWMMPWTPESGRHTIAVRATDGNGDTQTSDIARPAPDGATGWHTIQVTV